MEFKWNEFKQGELQVYCKTQKEANDFIDKCGEHQIYVNHPLATETLWRRYKEQTCYLVNLSMANCIYLITCCHIENCEINKLIEWSDYMEKTFTKADLETGMIVQLRNGNEYLVIKDIKFPVNFGLYGIGGFFSKDFEGFIAFSLYNNDLTLIDSLNDYNIIKVYKNTLNSNFFTNRELIWEREEPQKIKKIHLDEAEKLLSEFLNETVVIMP